MPNYSNPHIEQLISKGKWLIEPEMGQAALGKYLLELELLNNGAVTLRELYGSKGFSKYSRNQQTNNLAFDDDEEETQEVEPSYNDFIVTINSNNELVVNSARRYYEEEEKGEGNKGVQEEEKVIRVISFDGVMMKRGGLSTWGIDDICYEFDIAYGDEKVAGIVFEMDTGGGAVQAADMLGRKIKGRNKPVVVAATNIFSGGAWSTASADHIMGMGRTAGFGSIGVMTEIDDNTKYWEEKGWVTHRFYATKSKDKNRGYEEAIQGKYEYYRTTQLDPLCEMFIDEMVAGRSADKLSKKNKKWQTGRTFMTKDAIEIGLCDSMGTLNDAIILCQQIVNSQKENHMEEKLQQYNAAVIEAMNNQKLTGDDAQQQQQASFVNMQNAYAETYATAKMKDQEVTNLQNEVNQLKTKNTKLDEQLATANQDKQTAEEKVGMLEGEITTLEEKVVEAKNSNKNTPNENLVSKEAHDKIVQELATAKSERDSFKQKHEAQVTYTQELITANNLNVPVSKEQTTEGNQVEDVDDGGGNEKPLTPEQKAAQRLRTVGYKGNMSMGQKTAKG